MPAPPYYAVIFTSRAAAARGGYDEMAREMEETAAKQPGFLGLDSAFESGGSVTVSYWRDLASVQKWKQHRRHQLAQKLGREKWYAAYRVRVAKVEREYGMDGGQ